MDGFDDPNTLAAFVDARCDGVRSPSSTPTLSKRLPQRRQRRGLPAGATAPGAPIRVHQPAARRRRGTEQDHRGRSGGAGAAAAPPRPVGLIVCPPSLALKWQDEMRERCGLDFRHRQQRPDGQGPAQPQAQRQPRSGCFPGNRQYVVVADAARAAVAAGRVCRCPGHGQGAAFRLRRPGRGRNPSRRTRQPHDRARPAVLPTPPFKLPIGQDRLHARSITHA